MNKIPRILTRAYELPWAVLPSKLEEIRALLLSRADLTDAADEGVKMRAEARQRYTVSGAVAVVNVFGTLTQRANMVSDFSGGTSTELLTKQVRDAAADASISAIVLNFDSPGGAVSGVTEAHAAILQARDAKPIVASVNSMAASAALWLASAASEIVGTPSSEAGSVGVYAMFHDLSAAADQAGVKVTYVSAGKFKTENNPFEPLSEDGRAAIQSKVDHYYSMFLKDLSNGRGMSVKDIESSFGQGRMLVAKDALAAGMIDKIETFDQTISRISRGKTTPSTRKADDLSPAQKLDLLNI